MGIKDIVRAGINATGFTFRRYPTGLDQCLARQFMLKHLGISLVLDIGGNIGQFALELRHNGYTGRIVTFEPVAAHVKKLEEVSANDAKWDIRHLAIGDEDGSTTIHVADTMSSILKKSADGDDTVSFNSNSQETVPVARLDTLWPELVPAQERVFLKMDVQGFELHVLRGAVASLARVAGVESEMSLTAIYEGQASYDDIYGFLKTSGFSMRQVWSHGVNEKTGRMADCDGIFERTAT